MEIWIYIALVFVVYAKRSGMDCITIGRIPPHTVINQLGNPLGARGKISPKLYQQRQFNIRSDNSATDGLL